MLPFPIGLVAIGVALFIAVTIAAMWVNGRRI